MKAVLYQQREYFKTNITKSYQFRLNALRKLKENIIKNEAKINEALFSDLNKSAGESYLTEVGMVLKELSFHIKNLKKQMKIKKVKTPLTLFPAKSYTYFEPLGSVLVIAPWNYPFLLSVNPLVGAIAAGNTAVVKPSELAPNTANLINEIISETFNSEYIKVILGGVDEVTLLLKEKFDYIFFTGSSRVGQIVMTAASKHLTPLTLELGGKSPVVITKDVNLELAAKRIAYGKTINAGQTCIAPDYLLIEESLVEDFVKYFKESISKFYNKPLESSYYPKIINDNHFNRLVDLLKDEEILLGGNSSLGRIEPTLVLIKDLNSKLMKDEIFGPILPMITYQEISEAFDYIKNNDKPLAAYFFTNNKLLKQQFINEISAGGMVFNDTLMHFANQNLPFGGVGMSGFGKYHGKTSFETFSNQKAILDRKTYLDIKMRYHPISHKTINNIKKVIK